MTSIYIFLKDNFKYIFLSIIIICGVYHSLFLGHNFFNSRELDIYVLFNYLSNSNIGGWRLDKIIGTNMHLGDPSFNPWSILSLIYNLPIQNKILIHNVLFLVLNLYASISLFFLICFANPNIKKIYAILISVLIYISVLRFEFNYVFSWLLVFPTIIFTSIILFNYFQLKKNIYIFHLFIIYFIGFNLGSIFAIQQSLFFSFIFFIIYSIYFKKNLIIPYFKIITFAVLGLLIASSWIIYPYLFEKIVSAESFIRTADYKRYILFDLNLSFFKFIFNTFFGAFLNTTNISLPDKDITPFFNWNNAIGVFFNFIFLFYIMQKNSDNFWIFLSKFTILIYLIHIILAQLSPLYHSLNLFIFETMSWSKVNIEIYIFQLLLLSFFITDTSRGEILNKFPVKVYFYVVLIYLIFFIIFALDIFLNLNLLKAFFSIFLSFCFKLFFNQTINGSALNIFVDDFYDRLKFIINYELILFLISSLFLLLFFIFKKKIYKNITITFFLILIIFNNYLSASYFTPLEKDNFYLWENIKNEKIINQDERIIILSNNYLSTLNHKKVNYENLNEEEILRWINRNPILENKKYFGIMTPPFLSFSSNASFISKYLKNDNLEIFENVPEKIKLGFTSEKSFEILQEGIYNLNFINNLSIKYAYSVIDLKKNNILIENLEPFWNDGNLFLYKLKNHLPYSYIPQKIATTDKKFYEYQIKEDTVFLSNENFEKYKNLNIGKADHKIKIIKNSYFEIDYESDYENILVISNLYDDDWKHNSSKNLEIIKVNEYFTGIVLQPGKYNFRFYFDNSKYFIGLYISIIYFFALILFRKFFYFSKHKSK